MHALQLGLEDKLKGSLEPWLCYYCGECSEQCPKEAEPGETMMSLRRWLTSRYDFTGISRLFYRSWRWELFAILLAAFALNLLPVRFAAIAMIIGAFALFAAEAKFASHGVLTTGGIVLLTMGGLFLVDAPIPEMRVHPLTALAVSIPLGLITAFLMSIAVRARRNKVVTGEQGMIGEIGIAQTTLAPAGKVFVHGELWDAVSTVPVPAGERIVVRQVDGLTLRVDPVAAARPVMA